LYNAIRAMPTVLELYEKLKPKLGEEEARSLLEFIETSVDQRAATKADLQRTESALREDLHVTAASLREEMHATAGSLREEMHATAASLREELHATAASLREEMHATAASLREEMHKMQAELIKWSFAFWIGNIVVLSGIMFALLRGSR